MKISELQAVFSRVQQIAGDADIIIKAAEDGIGSAITDLEIHLDPSDATGTPSVTATLGTPAPAPEAPAEAQAPAADATPDPAL